MVSMELRVRYAETDGMRVVHHSQYLVWFEAGRSEWMRHHGIPYGEFEAGGVFVPVIEAHCRYLAPARYDEVITVETRAVEATRATMTFEYSVHRGEQLLAEGRTVHAFITGDGRPVAPARKLPEYWQALTAHLEPGAGQSGR